MLKAKKTAWNRQWTKLLLFPFCRTFYTRETNDGVNAVWHHESETIHVDGRFLCFYYK